MTLMNDSEVFQYGEIRCSSLLGFKRLNIRHLLWESLTHWATEYSKTFSEIVKWKDKAREKIQKQIQKWVKIIPSFSPCLTWNPVIN